MTVLLCTGHLSCVCHEGYWNENSVGEGADPRIAVAPLPRSVRCYSEGAFPAPCHLASASSWFSTCHRERSLCRASRQREGAWETKNTGANISPHHPSPHSRSAGVTVAAAPAARRSVAQRSAARASAGLGSRKGARNNFLPMDLLPVE